MQQTRTRAAVDERLRRRRVDARPRRYRTALNSTNREQQPEASGDTKTDYYKLLKLKKGFSEKELKTAYRNAAKKYHPDKESRRREGGQEVRARGRGDTMC